MLTKRVGGGSENRSTISYPSQAQPTVDTIQEIRLNTE